MGAAHIPAWLVKHAVFTSHTALVRFLRTSRASGVFLVPPCTLQPPEESSSRQKFINPIVPETESSAREFGYGMLVSFFFFPE